MNNNRQNSGIPRVGSSPNPWTPAKLFWLLLVLAALLGYANTEIVPESQAHQTLYQHIPANKFEKK